MIMVFGMKTETPCVVLFTTISLICSLRRWWIQRRVYLMTSNSTDDMNISLLAPFTAEEVKKACLI
jgi:hypothetical protein